MDLVIDFLLVLEMYFVNLVDNEVDSIIVLLKVVLVFVFS